MRKTVIIPKHSGPTQMWCDVDLGIRWGETRDQVVVLLFDWKNLDWNTKVWLVVLYVCKLIY